MIENEQKTQVSPEYTGWRLDKFLSVIYPDRTRSYLQNLIRNNFVNLNDRPVKSGHKILANDIVSVRFVNKDPQDFAAEPINLDIIFEDDHLLVVNKPAGMVVHPGAGNFSGTLVNGLLHYCRQLSGIGGGYRPGIVHRLDKNTSGLMVVAKNDDSHLFFQKQFDTRKIKRTYSAIVWGIPASETGLIEANISRSKKDRKKMSVAAHSGKRAITEYRLISDFVYLSELELTLLTGRTHQIRVHLNHIGYPVFGDPEYNGRDSQLNRLPAELKKRGKSLLKKINRQALHARKLSFIHPQTNSFMEFESNLPTDYQNVRDSVKDVLLLG